MDQVHVLSKEESLKAQQFHLQHFPDQDVPAIETTNTTTSNTSANPSPDDLGFYPDGTRRTLTDEQIALFRYSEIQRLLAQRRRQDEAREDRRQREAERSKRKRRQDQPEASVPARYQSDTMVHAEETVNELSYEESNKKTENEQPQKFHWPVLGS